MKDRKRACKTTQRKTKLSVTLSVNMFVKFTFIELPTQLKTKVLAGVHTGGIKMGSLKNGWRA